DPIHGIHLFPVWLLLVPQAKTRITSSRMASPRQRHSPAVRQRGRLRLGIAVAHTDNKPAALVVVPGSGFEEPVACTYR
ncbi:MAG: hypothetical protein QF437_28665, partial [Planctomycetota bacterium]|nr:hypothetical protein [Planctomycetota bacterium]